MTISSSLSFPLIIGWSKIASSYLYSILFFYGCDPSNPFLEIMTDRPINYGFLDNTCYLTLKQ